MFKLFRCVSKVESLYLFFFLIGFVKLNNIYSLAEKQTENVAKFKINNNILVENEMIR